MEGRLEAVVHGGKEAPRDWQEFEVEAVTMEARYVATTKPAMACSAHMELDPEYVVIVEWFVQTERELRNTALMNFQKSMSSYKYLIRAQHIGIACQSKLQHSDVFCSVEM